MKNKLLFVLLLTIGLVLAGCSDGSGEPGPGPWMDAGGTPVSGTGSGRADGVPEWAAEGHGGGVVTVDITLINGNITKALISGPNETPVIGGEAIDRASTSIPAKNTYNIDSMTGVTFTSDAIREAARLALIDAGVDPDLCPDS